MATLHEQPYPGDWEFHPGEDFSEYRRRIDVLFASTPTNQVIRFPWADGHAYYYVYSETPLTLQHIPYGDAWHVHDATIRGLRLSDIKKMILAEQALHSFFGDRNTVAVSNATPTDCQAHETISSPDDRIDSVARDALDAFWSVVARSFPEINTGDLGPEKVKVMEDTARDVIRSWLATNQQ